MHKDSWYGYCSCQSWLEKYRMSLNMVWIDCHNIRPSTFMCSFLWEQNVGQLLVRRKCNTRRKESRYLYHKIIDVYIMLSVVGQNGHFIAPCKGATLRSWVTLLTANWSGFICLFPWSPHGYMLSFYIIQQERSCFIKFERWVFCAILVMARFVALLCYTYTRILTLPSKKQLVVLLFGLK